MASSDLTHRLTPALLTEMRSWLADCEWADDISGGIDFDTYPDWWIVSVVDRHYEGGVDQFVADSEYYGVWRPDPESNMPAAVQRIHHRWCVAAGACYRLRNDCWEREGESQRAVDFEAVGDIYMERAMAIGREWERLTSDEVTR
jgi:hypothetical protein